MLKQEGWEDLELIEITVPPDQILFFSTNLMHCGARMDAGEEHETHRGHILFPPKGETHSSSFFVNMQCRPLLEGETAEARKQYFYPLLRMLRDHEINP